MADEKAATRERPLRPPTFWQALIPLAFLVVALALAMKLYGEDAVGGPVQVALLLAGALAAQGRHRDTARTAFNRRPHPVAAVPRTTTTALSGAPRTRRARRGRQRVGRAVLSPPLPWLIIQNAVTRAGASGTVHGPVLNTDPYGVDPAIPGPPRVFRW